MAVSGCLAAVFVVAVFVFAVFVVAGDMSVVKYDIKGWDDLRACKSIQAPAKPALA